MAFAQSFDQRIVKVKWGSNKLLMFYCSGEQVIYDRDPSDDTEGTVDVYATFEDFTFPEDDPGDPESEWHFVTLYRDQDAQPENGVNPDGDITPEMLGMDAWSYTIPRGNLIGDEDNKYYSYDPTEPVMSPFTGELPDGTYIETQGSYGALVLNVGKRVATLKKEGKEPDKIEGVIYLKTTDFARLRIYAKPVAGLKIIDVTTPLTDTGKPRLNYKQDMSEPKKWSDEYDSGFLPNTPSPLRARTYKLSVSINLKTQKTTYDLVDISGT